jgi:hypothetical protein
MCLTMYTSTCLVCALAQLPYYRTLYTGTCQQYTSITPLLIDTTSGACLLFRGATMLCDSYGHYTRVCAFSIVVPLRYVRDTVHLYMSLVLWYYYGICDLYCTLVYVFSMVVQLCFVIDTVQYKCTGKTPLKSFHQLGDKGLRCIREHLLRFQTNLGTRTSVGLFISMLLFERTVGVTSAWG